MSRETAQLIGRDQKETMHTEHMHARKKTTLSKTGKIAFWTISFWLKQVYFENIEIFCFFLFECLTAAFSLF